MPVPKKQRPVEYKPRRCKYCRLLFVPVVGPKLNRRNAEIQKFCCRKHKDAYHKNGGMNWERFMERVNKEVRKIVRDELGQWKQTWLEAARSIAREEIARFEYMRPKSIGRIPSDQTETFERQQSKPQEAA
jgi:hypothetical protein